MSVYWGVTVNITKFRLNLFQFADRALQGEPIEFIHKGVVFKVIPATQASKLSKVIPEAIAAPGANLDTTALMREMEAEWQKDWSQI